MQTPTKMFDGPPRATSTPKESHMSLMDFDFVDSKPTDSKPVKNKMVKSSKIKLNNIQKMSSINDQVFPITQTTTSTISPPVKRKRGFNDTLQNVNPKRTRRYWLRSYKELEKEYRDVSSDELAHVDEL